MSDRQGAVVIVGASSGIGRATALHLGRLPVGLRDRLIFRAIDGGRPA